MAGVEREHSGAPLYEEASPFRADPNVLDDSASRQRAEPDAAVPAPDQPLLPEANGLTLTNPPASRPAAEGPLWEPGTDTSPSLTAPAAPAPPPAPAIGEVSVPGYGRSKTPYYNEPMSLFDRDEYRPALDDFPMSPILSYPLSSHWAVGMASLNAVAIGASWQLGPDLSLLACFTRGIGTTAPELRRSLNQDLGASLIPESEQYLFERPYQTTVGIGLNWRF